MIDFFNLFLAPYTKNLLPEEVKEKLRLFLYSLNQDAPVAVSLGLELVVPEFLKESNAAGAQDKYGDFEDESRRLAAILLDLILEENKEKPVFNPSLIIKLRPEALDKKECQPILLQVHQLAVFMGTPYFANLCPENQRFASYAASGCRLGAEWKGDWELDTLRTGNLDTVALNLPRIAYQCEGKQAKFLPLLDGQLEVAVKALEIKYQLVKQRLEEGLLPFLLQNPADGGYFRRENVTRVVSLVGLSEAISALFGKPSHKDAEALRFAEKIAEAVGAFVKEHSRKPENRTLCSMISSMEAARRFAGLDAERFGWAKINVQGGKEQPYYTNVGVVPQGLDVSWQDRLATEESFHKLALGGHLTLLPFPEKEFSAEELLAATKQTVTTYGIGLFAYDRLLSYCANCKRLDHRMLQKCPNCGSVDSLITFSRTSTKYRPV